MENAENVKVEQNDAAELNQEQINSIFEARIARMEKYLQREGHDITKYDGPTLSAKEVLPEEGE